MNARTITLAWFASLTVALVAGCGAAADSTESAGTTEEAMSKGGGWGMPGGLRPRREDCSYVPWGTRPIEVALHNLGCQTPQVQWATLSGVGTQYWYVSVCETSPALNNVVREYGATYVAQTCNGAWIGPGYTGVYYDPNCTSGCEPPMVNYPAPLPVP
jgi:hypothetical protein